MNLLFVDACINRETSRTQRLCNTWLARRVTPADTLTTLVLENSRFAPLDAPALAERNALLAAGELSAPAFAAARQFADADELLVGAPYWDLSAPASLKCYLERISVCGITFRYGATGRPEGLCRAGRLTYITTAGGYIGENDFGFAQLRALAGLYGIPEVRRVAAEGLDILTADPEAILRETERSL